MLVSLPECTLRKTTGIIKQKVFHEPLGCKNNLTEYFGGFQVLLIHRKRKKVYNTVVREV